MKDAITLAVIEHLALGNLTFQRLYDKTLEDYTNDDIQGSPQMGTDEMIGITIYEMMRESNPLISRNNSDEVFLTRQGQHFFVNFLIKKRERIDELLEKLTSDNIKGHELI